MLLFDFVVFLFFLLQNCLLLFKLLLSIETLVLEEKQLFLEIDALRIRVDFFIDVVIGLCCLLQLIGHFIHDVEESFDELFLLDHVTILL